MKTGIMGGTFDPIHYGHLLTAEGVMEQLDLDRVIFIPTGMTPHKDNENVTDKWDRLKMTEIATEDNPKFEVSDMEIKRDKTCYTADTSKELKEMYKNDEFYYISGTDVIRDIKDWKTPEVFLKIFKIAAVGRITDDNADLNFWINYLKEKYSADIVKTDLPVIEISSTIIREKIKNKKSVLYMLPNEVINYIRKNKLYGFGE